MPYSLAADGDLYETRYYEILGKDFPNYEVFWQLFIVPITNRGGGNSFGLKNNIDPAIESIAMAHYSVFYHMGVARELQSKLMQEFSEDILFHLSAATEMVDLLIFSIAKAIAKLSNNRLIDDYSEQTILSNAKGYFVKQYSKDLRRFIERGQSVHVKLHQITDVTKPFMLGISEQADIDYTRWQEISNKIRHYRNTLAHNPKLGSLLTSDGTHYVPKESELHKYSLWSSMEHPQKNDDFLPLMDLLSEFQIGIVQATNALWQHLIAVMEIISSSELYPKSAHHHPVLPSADTEQLSPNINPPASGSGVREIIESNH